MNRRTTVIFAALAAALAFIVYLPALGNGFVNWDDQVYVYENPDIRSIDGRFFRWLSTAIIAANWHPLTMLSLAADHSIWGLNPLGYHLTNIVFHAVNTFLVAIVASRLTERVFTSDNNGPAFSGLAAALLFALHPQHVESVAWVSERKDVLSGFFFLLSILFYLRFKEDKKSLCYAFAALSFMLALLSKPMAVTLPAVLLILDLYPLGAMKDAPGVKKAILEKAPFFAISAAFAAVTIWAQRAGEAIAPLELYPPAARIMVAGRALVFYLYKMLLPSGLAPFYPRTLKPEFFSFEYLGSFVILILITVFSILFFKRCRLFLAAWLFYLVTLSPVIGIIQVGSQAAADRYMYLPSLGPFMVIAAGAVLVFKRKRPLAFVATAALSVLLAFLTVKQTAVWKDSISLWSREIAIYPDDAPIGYTTLGMAYKNLGDHQKALYYYNKALEIDPLYADAYKNRGSLFLAAGDLNGAVEDFTKSIRLNSQNPEVWANRGAAYINAGDYERAIEDLTKSISFNPENPYYFKSYYNRALAYKAIGRHSEAIEDFDKAIEMNPSFSGAYNGRGGVYLRTEDYGGAIRDFSAAVELSPNEPNAYYNLGIVYLRLNDVKKAKESFQAAASLGLKQAEIQLRQLGY